MMTYRGAPRGEPSAGLPPTAFMAFIQNHDQVGNRAFGDRITAVAPPDAVRAIAAIYLLAPQIPMLFMGEEWAASQPFPFFCDFEPPLAEAVRNGRRAEFARLPEFQSPEHRDRIPDPTDRKTFLAAKLNWTETLQGEHAEWRRWYKQVLAVRHREIIPRLGGSRSGRYEVLGDCVLSVSWPLGDSTELVLIANLKSVVHLNGRVPKGELFGRRGKLTTFN